MIFETKKGFKVTCRSLEMGELAPLLAPVQCCGKLYHLIHKLTQITLKTSQNRSQEFLKISVKLDQRNQQKVVGFFQVFKKQDYKSQIYIKNVSDRNPDHPKKDQIKLDKNIFQKSGQGRRIFLTF